jgi:hypothetical protein
MDVPEIRMQSRRNAGGAEIFQEAGARGSDRLTPIV